MKKKFTNIYTTIKTKLHFITFLLSLFFLLSSCSSKLTPLSDEEIHNFITTDSQIIKETRIKVERPITLYDAMAMALVNNLDYKVQLLEQAVAQGQFDIAKFDMFPKLTTTAGASHRNPKHASNSESVLTGNQSLEPSTSQDRDLGYADVTFSWNVIDFGVSYFRAKQEANKVLIAQEIRRKALHGLLMRIREAYWKAAASQKLKEKVSNIIAQINVALRKSEKVEEQQLQPPLQTLRYQRSLIDIIREMKTVKSELEKAEIDLYQLLNLPINQSYELSYNELNFDGTPSIDVNVESLSEMALLKRPELREEIYRYKISYDETKKALLQLLPGLELRASQNYDSNSFLVDQFWHNASTQVTSNLMDLVSYKSRKRTAQLHEDLSIKKRMALQLAILSQVHISLKDYSASVERLEEARKISAIDERISYLVEITARNDAEIELESIKTAAAAIATKLQEFQAYANFQNSLGRLLLSVGYDVVNIDGDFNDIDQLSEHFRTQLSVLDEKNVKIVLANMEERE